MRQSISLLRLGEIMPKVSEKIISYLEGLNFHRPKIYTFEFNIMQADFDEPPLKREIMALDNQEAWLLAAQAAGRVGPVPVVQIRLVGASE